MLKKENGFFLLVSGIWVILAALFYFFNVFPGDTKVYSSGGYTGVSVPSLLQIIYLFFMAGWPIFGWITLGKS